MHTRATNASDAAIAGLTLLLLPFFQGHAQPPNSEQTQPVISPKLAVPTPPEAPAISEITVQRESGMVRHPAWSTVTVRSDGTATYIGVGEVPRVGTWKASISSKVYAHLAQLVEANHVVDMYPFFGSMVTDISEVRVSVVRGGVRSTIIDRTNIGVQEGEREAPRSLVQIESEVEESVAHADWKKVNDNWRPPRYAPGKHQLERLLDAPIVQNPEQHKATP